MAIALLVSGVGNLWAQTDVTSTYLTNADFSGTYSNEYTINTNRYIFKPDGWTVVYSNVSTWNMTVVSSTDNMASNFTGTYAVPADNNKYMVRFRDNQPTEYVDLSQEITIVDAGFYVLSADLISEDLSKVSVSLYAGDINVKNTTNGTWENRKILLKVSENQKIKIGIKFKNEAAGGHKLGADNVQLLQLSGSTPDITSYVVTNPNFDSNINGWNTPIGGGKLADNKTDETRNFYESWNSTPKEGRMYQVIENLPQGTYELSIKAFTDQEVAPNAANLAVAVYAQGREVGTTSSSYIRPNHVTSSSFTEYKTYAYVDETGKLEIGMRQYSPAQFKWLGMDDVTLKYIAADNQEETYLVPIYQDKWSAAKTALGYAAALEDDTYEEITGPERTNLTAALNATISTIADYANTRSVLEAAYQDFIAAPANYALLDTEKVKASSLGMNSDAINTAAADSKTAVIALQDLKVAEYNHVADNYSYGVDLGTWTTTGSTGSKDEQHYSGTIHTYLEQSSEAWNSSAWTIKYDQDLTLPEGSYIFKVAGRKAASSSVTLSLTVKNKSTDGTLGSVDDFPEGDTGLGINTDGDTDFTTGVGHNYANGGKGRGWEWRYVKFTLAAETTVNIAVDAVATAEHMWVSFCDATVQSNDALTSNKIAFNVAMHDAEAVDQEQKMNAGVKTALQTAIGVNVATLVDSETYTAATNALTTATSNAIASIAAYAEVKDAIDEAKEVELIGSSLNIEAQENAYNNGTMPDSDKDDVIAEIQAALNTALFAQTLPAPITIKMTNPSFEASTWNDGWTVARNTTGTWDYKKFAEEADGITDGSQVLNAWAQQINYINVTQNVTLPKGGYRLTAAIFSDLIKNQHIAAKVGDKTFESSVMKGAEWQTLSVEFTVPDDNAEVTLGVYSNGNNVMNDSYGWFRADNFQLFYLGDAANMKITAGKYGTFIAPFDVTIPSGVSASKIITATGSSLNLTPVNTTIPANTPVVVTSEALVDETFYGRSTADADSYTVGLLTGVYTASTIAASDGENTRYVLQTPTSGANEGIQAFYKVTSDFTATANRCYLTVPGGGSVKAFFFDGDETAVSSVKADELQGATIYNLAGQRVSKAQKGVYIINGKKVAVK